MKNHILSLFAILLFCFNGFSQLNTSGGSTAQQLASYLAGPNITVYNATLTGSSSGYGKFNTGATATNLGIKSGVVLTNGSRTNIVGPNIATGTTMDNGSSGDAMLSTVAGIQTNDACILQFQFDVQSESVEFKYVFGSEEYPEFVNEGYNDVFAFYISGPGITGWENIALIPNTTTPVTIDNINSNSYWQYYVNNDAGQYVEYDGFTKVLVAKKTGLIPCQTYTLRLAIADAGDGLYDSGVFLEAGSLKQGNISAITQTIKADSVALEGCTKARFIFSLDSAKATNTQINFQIAGSAINGVDYNYIDSLFIIPAGQTSASIIIDAINDGISEGMENIYLIYSPFPCAPKDTVKLYINDYLNLQYENTVTNVSCFNANNGIVNFATTGGSAPFSYYLTNVATGAVSTYTANPITGLSTGTYNIKVSDGYGCAAEDVVVGNQYTGGPVFLPDGTGQSYSTSLPISGFSAGATLQSVSQLQSICMNMEHSRIGELEIKLVAPNGQQVVLKAQPSGATCNMGEPCANGPADAGNTNTSPGIGYTYCFSDNPTYGTMASEANGHTYTYTNICDGSTQSDKYLPSGSYAPSGSLTSLIGTPLNGNWTLTITDNIPNNNGWVFDWSISFTADPPDSIITITQPSPLTFTNTVVKPNCGTNNGSIDITVTGTTSPFTYQWSNGATTQDINNVVAGSYTVGVRDNNNCLYNYPILLSNNGTLALSKTLTNVACSGGSSGAIDLTVTGGTTPYTYSWNTGATTQDLSSKPAGTYIVNVTDGGGCIGVTSSTITQPAQIFFTSTFTNETCGNENGIIDLSVSGGTGTYSYLWSNSSIAQDPNYLQAGTYSVTIRDASNCTATGSFSLINEVSSCNITCNVAFGNSIVTPETCGNHTGSIDVSINNGLQPFQYNWSNGAVTQDLSSLAGGIYTFTVTDSKNCAITQSFTVTNNTGSLAASAILTITTCGSQNGAIDQTVSGGSLPYSYLWSNNSTNEDLVGLYAGTYSVNITDASGCSTTKTYTITNNTNTLAQMYGNAMNETCNNQTGSIDITITGGTTPYSYQWSNGSTTQDLINIHAGVYTCTVTASNGCKLYTPSYTVTNNSGTLSIFDTDILDEVCGNSRGRLNVDMIGGTTPYYYLWSNSQATQAINNLSSGTYSCTITDNVGCSVATGPLLISNAAGTLSITSVILTNDFCNSHQGAVDLNTSGGAAPVTYTWNNGSTTQDLIGLTAGSYSCTITDVNGCRLFANAIITNSAGSLSVSSILPSNESCGNANGFVNLTVSGGSLPLTFAWSNGASSEDLAGLVAGTYSCQVTDAFGCVVTTSSSLINQTTGLNATYTTANETCGNHTGNINLTPTGGTTPYTYLWSNGATTQDLSGLAMGTYSCSVHDATNCEFNTPSININNSSNGLIVSSAVIANETCGNSTGGINISITGGATPYTYNWSNGDIIQDISGVHEGTYTITVRDNNGCSTIRTYTVQNLSGTFMYNGQTINNELCGNGQGAINISYSGGATPVTYLWSNGANTEDISSLSAGTYSVILTDASGCSISHANITVLDLSGSLSAANSSVQNEVCGNAQGAVNISVSGGTTPYTFVWNNGASTEDLSNLSAGNYSCSISDVAGCKYIVNSFVLNEQGTLAVTNSLAVNSVCQNLGSINLTTTGATPITYAWNTGAITEDITGLSAGIYSCTITDAVGCSTVFNASISATGIPVITLNNITNDNCNQGTGAINIDLTSGTPNYSYLWSNGVTTQDINGLIAGTYSCVATDNNNCKDTIVQVITNITPFTITSIVTNASCSTCNNGSIDVTTSNPGGATIFYFWNPMGVTTEDVAALTSGTYTLSVYNISGCLVTSTFTVGFSTGFEQVLAEDNALNVFPNPSTGVFTVQYIPEQSSSVYIELINTLGEVVSVYEFDESVVRKNEMKLNLSKLLNGVYYLKVKDDNKFGIRKIILSK